MPGGPRGSRWAGLLVALALAVCPATAGAITVPSGFRDTVAIGGLTNPTSVRFASDGRIFVAEKSGLIKVFHGLSDTNPTTFADLRTQVDDYWDRGLLGLALDPGFPTTPYLYALFTYDAKPGGTAPTWNDDCPDPPGPTTDGCVVTGRLVRLTASGDTVSATKVLITDWCQQFPSHSIGDLRFGPDGALYVSGGEGANFDFADYGQYGSPKNPCGDPPTGVGGNQTAPSAEGGALRAQDVRTTADPTGLDGAVLRIDPATGAGLPTNPLAASSDANARRIIAYGLRNPFRFTVRPATSELWVGDVGLTRWEEIDRIATPTSGPLNFGWPCYQGAGREVSFDSLDLSSCEQLYAHPNVTAPYFAYDHSARVVSGESCPSGGASITGLAFYSASAYPAAYAGALFFADYTRNCIWVMPAGANGLPDPNLRATFVAGAPNPVDLETGLNGDLFYADLLGGAVHRIEYFPNNRPPTAVARASPTSGNPPMTVAFDATGSSDPEGDALTYAWDLDGDGAYDDSTAANPTFTYTTGGVRTVRLRVTDPLGASGTSTVTIDVGHLPVATISSPSSTLTWKVGDQIAFSGSATDYEDGPLPASALTWSVILHHCSPSGSLCHTHPVQDVAGVSSGSFPAPDHEYPSYLEVRLTARDSDGLTDTRSVRLDPKTVALGFAANPNGLKLTVGSLSRAAPFSRTVIVGSRNSISAPTPQLSGANRYVFSSWSDGGARSHDITAPAAAATWTAAFGAASPGATLLGTSTVGPTVDSNPAGMAEALRVQATASGTLGFITVYVDGGSSATKMNVGLYSENAGEPYRLQSKGSRGSLVAGAWNRVAVSNFSVVVGRAYWVAVLAPVGAGTLRFRDWMGTGSPVRGSTNRSLTALPGTWTSNISADDGPLSAYGQVAVAP